MKIYKGYWFPSLPFFYLLLILLTEQESAIASDKLKRMLNQTYALQFQMEMLSTSAQDISLS